MLTSYASHILQPCYRAVAGPTQILEPGASTERIVEVVNVFYEEFVDHCIKENHAYCNQMDVNDGEVNTKSQSKVNLVKT